jgi:hypothetical protein
MSSELESTVREKKKFPIIEALLISTATQPPEFTPATFTDSQLLISVFQNYYFRVDSWSMP